MGAVRFGGAHVARAYGTRCGCAVARPGRQTCHARRTSAVCDRRTAGSGANRTDRHRTIPRRGATRRSAPMGWRCRCSGCTRAHGVDFGRAVSRQDRSTGGACGPRTLRNRRASHAGAVVYTRCGCIHRRLPSNRRAAMVRIRCRTHCTRAHGFACRSGVSGCGCSRHATRRRRNHGRRARAYELDRGSRSPGRVAPHRRATVVRRGCGSGDSRAHRFDRHSHAPRRDPTSRCATSLRCDRRHFAGAVHADRCNGSPGRFTTERSTLVDAVLVGEFHCAGAYDTDRRCALAGLGIPSRRAASFRRSVDSRAGAIGTSSDCGPSGHCTTSRHAATVGAIRVGRPCRTRTHNTDRDRRVPRPRTAPTSATGLWRSHGASARENCTAGRARVPRHRAPARPALRPILLCLRRGRRFAVSRQLAI